MRRLILIAAVLTMLASTTLFAADWPQFLGPSANGFSPETGITFDWSKSAPKMLWKVALTDDGFAGPSAAGGNVFIIDHLESNDIVRAINIKTGKDAWKFSYEDGKGPNYGYSQSTPLVSAGKLYIVGRLGMVACLDAKTGAKVWSINMKSAFNGKKPQWEYAMSPVIDGNQLIVCPGGPEAGVVALDKNTGATIWKGGGSDIPGYATPVIAQADGKKIYIVMTGISLIGVDAKNGKLLWTIPWKTAYDINGATPIVMGNTAFITSGYGHGCALVQFSYTAAEIVKESKDLQSRFSTPLLYNGNVYCTEDSGNLVCMNPKTLAVAWKKDGFEWGPAAGIGDVALVLNGKSGEMTAVKLTPEKYIELGKFTPLGDQSWTAPIIADGKLVVRNKSALACFSLK